MKKSVEIDVVEDSLVNAAVITFDRQAQGRQLRTFEVNDGAGDTVATVTFAPDGALVQIELLDAVRQLPASLR